VYAAFAEQLFVEWIIVVAEAKLSFAGCAKTFKLRNPSIKRSENLFIAIA
jgi:hypothetical protein